eukprot:TRINITY_DN4480_c0_g1_i2.p1 TRINITY_DN4480_c0_g1~~TRINITY_DN4480_c0_g1_i2.p1  ORF type:complete len:953 (-),score=229.01 TRINITY_DN4480_c0_g1_i2:485-3304(-)
MRGDMDGSTPPPSFELVAKAINSLYNSPDYTEKADASRWLQDYQNSPFAWTISDQLLQQKLSLETCYFAAQTLRSKIQSNFHELPRDVHESLRNSLLDHLRAVTGATDTAIRTQLCLAMADLILLMPEWKNSVPELMTKLNSMSTMLTLLEVLMVLPEEVDSRHLRLGANRRHEVKDDLKNCAEALSQLLDSCLSNATDNQLHIQNMVIKCYSSWLILGVLPVSSVSSSGVIHLTVSVLSTHASPASLHESSSDCIINLLTRLEKENDEALERQIFETVMNLKTPYHLAVGEEDLDKCLNYCRIFTETGESFLTRMVASTPANPHFSIPVLDTVLLCCGHLDYEMPDVTFNLWYRLSEELYSRNDDDLINIFRPYITSLILCLSRHCQMEPDMVGVLSEDEDFAEFRSRVSDLIKDCVFIVGSSAVFGHMYTQLKATSQWEQTEATLFVMQAVARNIHPEEKDIVPAVLQEVLTLPAAGGGGGMLHQAVRVTATRLIGELSEWIGKHPDTLQAVLEHLLHGLQDPVVASEAANSLQSICSMCKEQMTQHFGGLLHILEQLDNFKLKPEPAKGLVKGAALILGTMHEKEQLSTALQKICELQVNPLNQLMENPQQAKIVRLSTGDPVLYLDRLADVFRYVSPSNGCRVPNPHPCKGVIENSWPVLSRACDVYADNERITERACRTIRFAVRCLGAQSSTLLPSLVGQLIRLYESHKHSCYLYLGSILVDEFACEEGCVAGLLEMVQSFIQPTYSLLAREHGLRDNPGTVDDFFRLNNRFLQRAPMPYLQTEFLKSVIECGLMSASLDHRDANTSVMKFFETLLRSAHTRPDLQDFQARQHLVGGLYKEFGNRLVETLVRSAVLTLPYYTYADIGDVLYHLSELDKVTFCTWLEATLKNLPNNGTPAVTSRQLEEFHQAVAKAEDPGEVAHQLREFVRLWR